MASINKVILEDFYVSRMLSIPDIAKELGINYSAARTLLVKYGVVLRSRSDGIRAASHKMGQHLLGKKRVFTQKWKDNIRAGRVKFGAENAAGISHKTNGYTEITVGEHKGRGLHVVLMEADIGRALMPNEVVHHKDENKHNNQLSNLELMTRSQHARHHINERIQRKKNGQC